MFSGLQSRVGVVIRLDEQTNFLRIRGRFEKPLTVMADESNAEMACFSPATDPLHWDLAAEAVSLLAPVNSPAIPRLWVAP